jgi:hypothetical protein
MKKMKEKSKIYNIQDKTSTPPQTKTNHKLPPQTKPYGWQTSSSELKRVVAKIRGFLMQKIILPLSPRHIKLSVKFNQRRLLPPEDKYRPLKQQGKSKHICPRHKSHKNKNSHQRSQSKPTHHPQQEKHGSQGQLIQNRDRNQPTESHIYTGDEHHDGTTWIVTKAM